MIDVLVTRRWNAAVDVIALELAAADGGPLPAFEAGACVDVLTPGGHLRPYSLCGTPGERCGVYRIAVLRERHGRGGSNDLHDHARVGTRLRLHPPRNAFPLVLPAVHTLLLGGGIGVTPLLPMAETLWQRGTPFELHHVARNADRAVFHADLLRQRHAGRLRFHWTEGAGRPDLASILQRAPHLSQVYACGPAPFMAAAVAAFVAARRPAMHLHVESFGPPVSLTRAAPSGRGATPGSAPASPSRPRTR
ncbi:MAG: vanillate O-demethylase oxidoreductase [Pseudomonadota bacterium]|jgi:vanillate O-demethylase ferredoxin subunit